MSDQESTRDARTNPDDGLPPVADCLFLTGPTASGKSSVGVRLARRLDAEIISLDSMAVYRGMDIGTAKPTREQRQAAPHHLLDVCEPTENYSLSQYVETAHAAVEAIRARGRRVLFVGGTPLYLKSLLRGVFQGPPADWDFRTRVEREVEQVGLEALHQRLWQVDPPLAAKLHPSDKRRIIRALEVHRITGEPLSHRQFQFEEANRAVGCRVFTLSRPRRELHARIAQRVERMTEGGLLEEARQLAASHGALGRTASQAVGYRECLAHLAGELPWAEATRRILVRTRQFARRQETWFRSLPECEFVGCSAASSASDESQWLADSVAEAAETGKAWSPPAS